MLSVTLLKPEALTAISAQIADIYEQLAAFTEFDPDLYSTTTQINDMLAAYVPKTRTIASGNGVKINGGASATLSGTVTVSLDFASNAEVIAGSVTNKPAPPSGVKAAIDAALAAFSLPGLKGVQFFTSSGTYTPTAGTTKALVFVTGGGGGGGGGTYAGPGGGGGTQVGILNDPGATNVVVGAGGAGTGISNEGQSGGASTVGSIVGGGGGGGSSHNVGGGAGTGGLFSIVGGTSIYSSGLAGGSFFAGAGSSGFGAGGAATANGKAGCILILEF